MGFELIAGLGAILALILGAFGLHQKGYSSGKKEAEAESKARLLDLTDKKVKEYERINNLSDADVDKRLRDKWKK